MYPQVILYDKDSPAMNVLPRWQKILWDMSLLSSPFLVLIFHVGFWRKVCFVYKSIDTSKELIKGRDIWSAKVWRHRRPLPTPLHWKGSDQEHVTKQLILPSVVLTLWKFSSQWVTSALLRWPVKGFRRKMLLAYHEIRNRKWMFFPSTHSILLTEFSSEVSDLKIHDRNQTLSCTTISIHLTSFIANLAKVYWSQSIVRRFNVASVPISRTP